MGLQIGKDEILVSYDVTASDVPQDKAIHIF